MSRRELHILICASNAGRRPSQLLAEASGLSRAAQLGSERQTLAATASHAGWDAPGWIEPTDEELRAGELLL